MTLKDKLSRLSYRQAVKLLGSRGDALLQQGGLYDIDLDRDVRFDEQQFRLLLSDAELSIRLHGKNRSTLGWRCSCHKQQCEHIGAALSLILEEKTPLGLAKAPPEPQPVAALSDSELREQALGERRERAAIEKMRVKSLTPKVLWSDYLVTNATSGKTYRAALRGWEPGDSYCSCPDFRKNTLGVCKHLLHALAKVEKRFPAAIRNKPYRQKQIALHLRYGKTLELRFLLPDTLSSPVTKVIKPWRDKAIDNGHQLLVLLQRLERLGEDVLIYPDAEEYLERLLFRERIQDTVRAIRRTPDTHPLRENLLKIPLLPYQLEGIAFAVGAGRAILADEMGLGKTIQGIGVAELLAREAGIERVLVVTPASVKSQWRSEIAKFCERDSQIVIGDAKTRAAQYRAPVFFSLCNYEQVLRDSARIGDQHWDLIILDEGQRIKNWEAKTSQTIKALRSRFALLLTGTPLENRLDDLYSVVEFVDDRRLGPDFDFYNRHRIIDEKGKVLGYRNLAQLRKTLQPILLRRTRGSVRQQLPERSTKVIRIAPTEAQLNMHGGFHSTAVRIAGKRYLTEMDLLRLQKALLMCRLTANSTSLVDGVQPGYSSKLQELDSLLAELAQEEDRKIIVFSEWTRMLNLIEPLLQKHGWDFVRLDGSVPQKKRQQLVRRFQNDSDCSVFLTTNAGATGLNLQAANTVINIDLPWNPALLEQRIARAHRMGQQQPVQVYLLVTEQTLEENLLATLSAKKELALAALDPDTDIDQVDLTSSIDDLRRRLEILLGAKPEAPTDEAQQRRELDQATRQQRLSETSGQLVAAAFGFINELLPAETAQTRELSAVLERQLGESLHRTDEGDLQLTLKLPDERALSGFAQTLARLLNLGGAAPTNKEATDAGDRAAATADL
ncbi:MAG: DEAD/DEAH box helicase [Pseudohongiellaceae bacterium]